MGYSVATPIRSTKLHVKMLAFLDANYKTWPELNGRGRNAPVYVRGPLGDDLSYDHGKCRIGFDFNTAGGERVYMFCVIRWLALRVGRKALKSKRPYYIYDGDEKFEVFTKRPAPEGCTLSDQWGVPLDPKKYGLLKRWWVAWELEISEEPKALEVIRAELQRLDALWEKVQ